MTLPAPTYDLVLLLDGEAEEETRAKIVADASEAIAAKGELLRHDVWGTRALTYQIAHKTTAEYHLLQFHTSTPELLRDLEHMLRITDGIVRFRIIKLKPGTPAAPETLAAAPPGAPDTLVAASAGRAAGGESEAEVAAEAGTVAEAVS